MSSGHCKTLRLLVFVFARSPMWDSEVVVRAVSALGVLGAEMACPWGMSHFHLFIDFSPFYSIVVVKGDFNRVLLKNEIK